MGVTRSLWEIVWLVHVPHLCMIRLEHGLDLRLQDARKQAIPSLYPSTAVSGEDCRHSIYIRICMPAAAAAASCD
jgi:hypothetical protein